MAKKVWSRPVYNESQVADYFSHISSHMVNIVTLGDGTKYMLDVGFGGNGPTRPLLLDASRSQVQHIEPAEMRVTKQNIQVNTDPDQKLWVYQHRINPDSEWLTQYCFTELEFLPQDYQVMNFYTSQSRTKLKKRVGGETEHLKTCENEEERVKVLEEYFDIKLSAEEAGGIEGMITALAF
ncbi:hypothetical protein P7C71_g2620, partial [Lecanoromycetidae sp. Uapishka_2]